MRTSWAFALLLALVAPAAAYEFPFNVVRFNPGRATVLGRRVDVKYPAGMTAEAVIGTFARGADRLVDATLARFGAPPPGRRLKIYLYASPEQKRRLLGSPAESELEDGAAHLVFRSADQVAGDLAPLTLERSVGRCEAAFLAAGARHLFEPVFGGRLPEGVATSREVECAFAEFGLFRPVAELLRMDRDARPLDERGRVTAGSFVRFLVDAYGPEFFLAWYVGRDGFLRRFPEVYGFPLEDAERQWLGALMRERLSDERFLDLRDRFERLGMKTLR